VVYRYYIKRGAKRFGPYYYRSYRENGKFKKEYLGTSLPKGYRKTNKLLLILILALIGLTILGLALKPAITGFVTREEAYQISTIQEQVEINKPVKWQKTITLTAEATAEELVVKIPEYASDIKVNGKSDIKTTKESWLLSFLKKAATITGFAVQEEQQNLVINVTELNVTVTPIAEIIEVNITNITEINISEANVTNITTINVTEEAINISGVAEINVTEENITNITEINITEINITNITEVAEAVNVTNVTEKNITKIEIEYKTLGPKIREEQINPYRKRVIVYSDIHYENITTYTSIPELTGKESAIKLYHIVNGNRELVEDVEYLDENNNGLIDKLQWIVPSLSEQEYEIDITVINVQSYPTVGGNWVVMFNTTGRANLTITAINGTTWSNENELNDLKFLEIKCGDEIMQYEWINNSVFISDYECNQTSYETSKVLTEGKHHLEFMFGSDVDYAHNQANTIYDFSTGSGTDKWAYTFGNLDATAGPPYTESSLAPEGEITTAVTTTNLASYDLAYVKIVGSTGDFSPLYLKLTINENPTTITGINITVQGIYTQTANTKMSVWVYNFSNPGYYNQIGANYSMTSTASPGTNFTRTITTGFSDFINASGIMFILFVDLTANIDEYFDYVYINVSYTVPDNPPNVTLNSPSNNSWNASRTVNFSYTPKDDSGFKNCSLWTNESGWSQKEANTSAIVNGSVNKIQETFSADGTYLWNIECYDNATTPQSNFSANNWTINIDTQAPIWASNLTNASDGTTRAGQSVYFNVTFTDANPKNYTFAINHTGSWVNYTGKYTSGVSIQNITTIASTAEGKFVSWYFWANDTGGYSNQTDMWNFTVATVAPTWSNNLTNASSATKTQQSVYFNVTFTESNPDKYKFATNQSGSWVNYTGSYTSGVSIQNISNITATRGKFISWYFWANDTGGYSNQTDTWNFTVANTAPIFIQSLTNQTAVTPNSFYYDVNCSDADSDAITYSVNDTKLSIDSATGEITDAPAESETGNYSIMVNCTDTYNITSQTFGYMIRDGTPPNTTQQAPADNYYNDTSSPVNVSFNCTVVDGYQLRNISLYMTNASNGSFAFNSSTNIAGTSNQSNWTLALVNGNYTWACRSFDLYNNSNWTTNRTLKINWTDVTPPVTTLVVPADNYYNDSNPYADINFTCNATDGYSLRNISLYITNSSNQSFSFNSSRNITGISNWTNWTLTLGVGNYTWNCLTYDLYNNSDWADANRTLKMNFTEGPILYWNTAGECNIQDTKYYNNKTIIATCDVIVNGTTGAKLNLQNVTFYMNETSDYQYALIVQAGATLNTNSSTQFQDYSGSAPGGGHNYYIELYGNSSLNSTTLGDDVEPYAAQSSINNLRNVSILITTGNYIYFEGASTNNITNVTIPNTIYLYFQNSSINTVTNSTFYGYTYFAENSSNTVKDSYLNSMIIRSQTSNNLTIQNLTASSSVTNYFNSTTTTYKVNLTNVYIEDIYLSLRDNSINTLVNVTIDRSFSFYDTSQNTITDCIFQDYGEIFGTSKNTITNTNFTATGSLYIYFYGTPNTTFNKPYSSITQIRIDNETGVSNPEIHGYLNLTTLIRFQANATCNRYFPIYVYYEGTSDPVSPANVTIKQNGTTYTTSGLTNASGYVELNITFDNATGGNLYNFTLLVNDTTKGNITFLNDTSPDGIILYIPAADAYPTWSNNGTNASNATKTQQSVYFNVTLTDDVGGGYYKFAFYNGSSWSNTTPLTWTSPQNVQNVTTITATRGMTVQWYWWFNDSIGQANTTDTWNFTVANTAPTQVILDSPANNNITTNRTPQFNWTAVTDADGDSINYTILINCSDNGGQCTLDDREVNLTGITNTTYVPTTNLKLFGDDSYYYNWSVRAYDGYNYSQWSSERKITINSLVELTLTTNNINFGELQLDQKANTTNPSYPPFVIRNDGNCYNDLNISISDDLWTSVSAPSQYFQYKVDNVTGEEGAFNSSGSQVNWSNVPVTNTTFVDLFNYSDAKDSAEIDILVWVPLSEPAGSRSSILIFSGWYVKFFE